MTPDCDQIKKAIIDDFVMPEIEKIKESASDYIKSIPLPQKMEKMAPIVICQKLR